MSESFIKQLHLVLKTGTSDSREPWFKVGDYKLLVNEVGDRITTDPKQVKAEMKKLLDNYNQKEKHSFEEIVEFHVEFESIHPFQDGNGRVGILIAFKVCLKNNIVPFIILDSKKMFYYRGLKNWSQERGWLIVFGRIVCRKKAIKNVGLYTRKDHKKYGKYLKGLIKDEWVN